MYKAVMFDLDGTLGDTLPLVYHAFRQASMDVLGRELSRDSITRLFGVSEEGMLQQLMPEHWEDGLAAYRTHYREMHQQLCPAPFPGARQLLDLLRDSRVPTALITGKGLVSTAVTLERFRLARSFTWIATGDERGSQKARHMRQFVQAQGIGPDEAVYVGDAVSDIAEAQAAGVDVFAAGWAETAPVEALAAAGPTRLFTDFGELLRYFEEALVERP